MKTKATTPQPYIINTGSNGGAIKSVVALIGGGVLLYFGNKAYKAYLERKGESNLDTPEGQIALQLKNVFDATIVSDEDFRRVYLQVNNSNKDAVFKEYRRLTQRNLSDDIAKHISTSTLTKSNKTEAINNKIDGVIKINSNDEIDFLVSPGSKVVFSNSLKATTMFATTKGLLWYLTATDVRPNISALDKIKATVSGRKDVMIVKEVKILPYNGIKLATDWTKYFRPVVNTRKVFALVRVGIKNNKGKTLFLWVDARDLSRLSK